MHTYTIITCTYKHTLTLYTLRNIYMLIIKPTLRQDNTHETIHITNEHTHVCYSVLVIYYF